MYDDIRCLGLEETCHFLTPQPLLCPCCHHLHSRPHHLPSELSQRLRNSPPSPVVFSSNPYCTQPLGELLKYWSDHWYSPLEILKSLTSSGLKLSPLSVRRSTDMHLSHFLSRSYLSSVSWWPWITCFLPSHTWQTVLPHASLPLLILCPLLESFHSLCRPSCEHSQHMYRLSSVPIT